MTGKIQTVLGDIPPSALGRTLTHEHLAMNFLHNYCAPPERLAPAFMDNITLRQVGVLRQYPYSSSYNLKLDDDDSKKAVMNDVREYKKFGGGTIVENSTEGLNRDLPFMEAVSRETGVHVVAGTGFYIEGMQSPTTLRYSEEDMYNHMMEELTVGCKGHESVKAGFIGEVASMWPVHAFERSAIRAAGAAAAAARCGASFHPHREAAAPAHVARLYLEAGGRARRAVMSHLDRTLLQDDQLLDFAQLGLYCQFDLFGIETSYYQLNVHTDMPSDAQRIDKIKLLIDNGYEDRILMSHDIHTKHRLTDFGGHGYSHILNNVLFRMEAKGISREIIDKITITNPANWLTMP